MTDPNDSFTTPVGRLVGGSVHTQRTKGFGGKDLDNPEYVVMVAVPKAEAKALVEHIKAAGKREFSHNPALCDRPDFSWKVIDGDSNVANLNGNVPCEQEGYPGHYVFTCATQFAIEVVGADPRVAIEPRTIKTGDWIRVGGNVRGNRSDTKPGVYLNLQAVQFVREGAEIKSKRKTAASFFGGDAPAHDIVNKAVNAPPPPGGGAPPIPPSPSALVLTPKGVSEGCDPAAWLAGGQWTEDLLRQHGYIQ